MTRRRARNGVTDLDVPVDRRLRSDLGRRGRRFLDALPCQLEQRIGHAVPSGGESERGAVEPLHRGDQTKTRIPPFRLGRRRTRPRE